jgi:hypothetical protein
LNPLNAAQADAHALGEESATGPELLAALVMKKRIARQAKLNGGSTLQRCAAQR